MPHKTKTPTQPTESLCPWCEDRYRPASDYTSTLCPDCRAELMEQPKDFLIDMIGGTAGVNVIVMSSLARYAPDAIEALGLLSTPERQGFSRRPAKMKELTRKDRRVQ